MTNVNYNPNSIIFVENTSDVVSPVEGQLYYNSTDKRLYYYNGSGWLFFLNSIYGYDGTERGLFAGGHYSSARVNTIDYISIATLGNSVDFGDLSGGLGRYRQGACASTTRACFGGGDDNYSTVNTIDYVTISTLGNATDFGDMTVARRTESLSNSTRGVFGGGYISGGVSNVIDYITIASVGNATDFGDMSVARGLCGTCASSTRGVFSGGNNSGAGTTRYNVIDYITIASTGNATDFGDLSVTREMLTGCSNSTRGVFASGYNTSPALVNVIDYITIDTTGNATDFGDLLAVNAECGACSSSTRAVFVAGQNGTNVIQYITIGTTGNAADFGDISLNRYGLHCTSNCHGGLS